MVKLSTLKKRAQLSTKWRGHSMRWDAPQMDGLTQMGFCKFCDMYVELKTKPAPNQIDIGGTAVALNCIAKQK